MRQLVSSFFLHICYSTHMSHDFLRQKKIRYERERREKLAFLFSDLTTLLVDCGYKKTSVEKQVDSLTAAIDYIKKLREENMAQKKESPLVRKRIAISPPCIFLQLCLLGVVCCVRVL